ncbi:OLC1v1038785C1 [Oldenlandia corymbosa var. corymbosa]|uniref:OLC1v1038785C1 n=1 Tax=Oldenlandia corymbosa var. corymbosa TaxID=529605 RepID=A0AAV1D0N5_OLDCO|nr:OLC1v1038785C1 [Oldenlandia corymbosa var. corymbosa]
MSLTKSTNNGGSRTKDDDTSEVGSEFLLAMRATTNPDDYTALQSIQNLWENVPPNWSGSDPCGANWDGIGCINSRIVSITLASMGLRGQLSGDIAGLTKLQTLSLNSNKFIGPIPPSIGALSSLYWLDLADNKLSGRIPVSSATEPGLDLLVNTKHFHFGKNQLSGEIPPQLLSANMTLIHLLLDSNELTGNIPATLADVQSLEVVRLDRNSLSGQVPPNLNKLVNIHELFLSNNDLTGPLPDLTGLDSLHYLDMSNNTFNASNLTWFSTLPSLTTLVMENTNLQGEIPHAIFGLRQLQSVILRNNRLNGTLSIGPNNSNDLQLIDLQNNSIEYFTEKAGGYGIEIVLLGNPYCQEGATKSYCILPQKANSSYSTPINCSTPECRPDQIASPKCICANPYTGILFFRAPSFSDLGNSSIYASLEQNLMFSFHSQHLPVDSVSLSYPSKNLDHYLTLNLQVFPSGQEHFNRSAIAGIGFVLSNQTFKPPNSFGPFFFIANVYEFFCGIPSGSHKSSISLIIGAAAGSVVLITLLLLAGVYALRQKRRAEVAAKHIDPFASWNSTKTSAGVPELKSARSFTFEEVKKYTDDFSENNDLGSGGYGKVYKGTLPGGLMVAIKRAKHGSMQGHLEFKTEIELLSRVHHKNLVSLVGFCFDKAEEMLVYEFIPNGTLKDSLSGISSIRSLDSFQFLHLPASKLGLCTCSVVGEVRQAVNKTKDLCNLYEMIDPLIVSDVTPKSLEKFVDLALRCIQEEGVHRPTMSEAVKELENIMELAGVNPNSESASTSGSYQEASKGYEHPYYGESLFVYSGGYSPMKVEPK